jgi:hypothetical protein
VLKFEILDIQSLRLFGLEVSQCESSRGLLDFEIKNLIVILDRDIKYFFRMHSIRADEILLKSGVFHFESGKRNRLEVVKAKLVSVVSLWVVGRNECCGVFTTKESFVFYD